MLAGDGGSGVDNLPHLSSLVERGELRSELDLRHWGLLGQQGLQLEGPEAHADQARHAQEELGQAVADSAAARIGADEAQPGDRARGSLHGDLHRPVFHP